MSRPALLTLRNVTIKPSSSSSFTLKIPNFTCYSGQTVALVGESGSGKSLLAGSILQVYGPQSSIRCSMDICFDGQSIIYHDTNALDALRNRDIAIMLQDPQQALNPLHTVYTQLAEVISVHCHLNRAQLDQAVDVLINDVSLPASLLHRYPHQLSGGERQRVLLACAIAHKPRLLILDEPTTALDMHLQRNLLDRIKQLQEQYAMSILLISHDLNMVRHYADYLYIIDDGCVVEHGEAASIFKTAQNPKTQALLAANDFDISLRNITYDTPPVLSVDNLSLSYRKASAWWSKVDYQAILHRLYFVVFTEENLGIIGESGSGKSSLARAIVQLEDFTGDIRFSDSSIAHLPDKQLQPYRKYIQMVFQDPFASLNPRHCVLDILSEGLLLHYPQLSATDREARILQVIYDVGLDSSILTKFPFMFSGGQRQRIAIARALVLAPRVIILDEPTTALDSTIAKKLLHLLLDLQQKYAISYIFITHNCDIVERFCHRVMVLDAGKTVEMGPTLEVFSKPQHPKTRFLLQARFQ